MENSQELEQIVDNAQLVGADANEAFQLLYEYCSALDEDYNILYHEGNVFVTISNYRELPHTGLGLNDTECQATNVGEAVLQAIINHRKAMLNVRFV